MQNNILCPSINLDNIDDVLKVCIVKLSAFMKFLVQSNVEVRWLTSKMTCRGISSIKDFFCDTINSQSYNENKRNSTQE